MIRDTFEEVHNLLTELTSDATRKRKWAERLLIRVQEIRKSRGANRSKEISKLESQILLLINPHENEELIDERIIEANEDFITILRKKFQNLTEGEILLSCYLRMELNSDIIASLKGIDIKSVNMARYRLKKKLGLADGQSLDTFLQNI